MTREFKATKPLDKMKRHCTFSKPQWPNHFEETYKNDDIQEHCLRNEVSRGDVPQTLPRQPKSREIHALKVWGISSSNKPLSQVLVILHPSKLSESPPNKKSWKILSLSHKKKSSKHLNHQSFNQSDVLLAQKLHNLIPWTHRRCTCERDLYLNHVPQSLR